MVNQSVCLLLLEFYNCAVFDFSFMFSVYAVHGGVVAEPVILSRVKVGKHK